MKTGDTVRDGQGNSYQLGQLLGRGLWGKTFIVRRESTDTVHALKVPLGPEDVRGDASSPDAAFTAAREALMETARLYEQGGLPFLPRLEARFTLPDGQPALLLPRYADSLEKRLAEGLPIGQLLDVLLQVVRQVRQLAGSSGVPGGVHGGLRPSNVLFTERGEVVLSDIATPAVRKGLGKLLLHAPSGQPYLPPEITEATADPQWTAGADTYAIAMMLWRGILGDPLPSFPRRGLDKGAVVAIKDKLVERMKGEDSNPRFHGRLAERVGVFLSRALSRETQPSPPYRFTRMDELQQRLEEIVALIRPQVSSVGKVMPERTAAKPWFDTEESVAFSCTVGCTTGIEGHEEIGVGIAVFDVEKDQRLKDLDLGYAVDKHPSGRYRFAFRIAGLNPGVYKARVAFAIRDSGQPPATTEHEFEVRAAPGWKPPAEVPVPVPLSFARETTNATPTAVPVPSEKEPDPTPAPPPPMLAPPKPLLVPNPPPVHEAPRVDKPLPRPVPLRSAAEDLPVKPTPPPSVTITRPAAPRPEPPAPPPEPPEEPAFKAPKNWSYEPIPKAPVLRDEEEPEDRPSAPAEDPDDVEPGILEKAVAQLRNDPYVLVMASLAAVIGVLLILYLVIRS